jgi:hypothetical protein
MLKGQVQFRPSCKSSREPRGLVRFAFRSQTQRFRNSRNPMDTAIVSLKAGGALANSKDEARS